MKLAAGIVVAIVLCAHAASGQQRSDPLPFSTLPLRLVGVLRDPSRPARSGGLVQCGDGHERHPAWFFSVGDRVCDVAEMKEVLEESVVIRNLLTSRLERLALPTAGARPAPHPSPPSPSLSDEAPETASAPLVQPVSGDVVTVEIRREMLERSLANLPEVLTSALATPRYAAGGSGSPVVEGFEMSHIKAGGLVEQLGLRDGDVLQDFNGRKLDSVAAVTGLFAQVQALSGAKMTVLRDGRRLTFVFSVK